MSALTARGLTVRYAGQPASAAALVGVDLSLEAGERLLLLGPNGAGKSTFIRVFAGLTQSAAGQALLFDGPPRHARQRIGVVSHATYLHDELSALENLRFYAELYGVHAPAQRATSLLQQIGLDHVADERVSRLSRGQQQRVTIARALLHDPAVLLLDEPDTGLDVAAIGMLQSLVADGSRTVVMTTHHLANGLALGTRVAVLAQGRLVHEEADVSTTDAARLTELLESLARG